MPTPRSGGSFKPGLDYDLVWATTPWGWANRPFIGSYAARLQRYVEDHVEGLVITPQGYPRDYAQRTLFRVRIRELRGADMTIDEVLQGGIAHARGCLFGYQGPGEVCAADLLDTWQDPESGNLYPSPIALEYAPQEPGPERPERHLDLVPVLAVMGAAGIGVGIWGIMRMLRARESRA